MIYSKIITERFSDISTLFDRLSSESGYYIFRGMASASWRIQTSIDRLLCHARQQNDSMLLSETNQNTFSELHAQNVFIQNHSHQLNRLFGKETGTEFKIDESNFLHLPIILQHYGYPTRIQEWTTNWKIALFFCLDDANKTEDFCVWSMNETEIPDIELCLDDPDYLYPTGILENNRINAFYHRLKAGVYRINKGHFQRKDAQKGVNLTTGRADYMDFQQHIEECTWISENNVHRYVVDSSLRNTVHKFLNTEGITHEKLFPNDITDGYII